MCQTYFKSKFENVIGKNKLSVNLYYETAPG